VFSFTRIADSSSRKAVNFIRTHNEPFDCRRDVRQQSRLFALQTIVRSPETSRSCSAIRPPPSKRRLSDRLSRRLGPGSARPFDRTSFEDGASVFGRAHRAGIQLGGTSRCSEGFSCVSSFHLFLFRICPPKFSKVFAPVGARIGVSGGSAFEAKRVFTRRVAVHRGGSLISSTESP